MARQAAELQATDSSSGCETVSATIRGGIAASKDFGHAAVATTADINSILRTNITGRRSKIAAGGSVAAAGKLPARAGGGIAAASSSDVPSSAAGGGIAAADAPAIAQVTADSESEAVMEGADAVKLEESDSAAAALSGGPSYAVDLEEDEYMDAPADPEYSAESEESEALLHAL